MLDYLNDPLMAYHNLLRMGRQSGYPNLQFANPHPYQMAWDSMARPKPYPFRYNMGRPQQIKAAPAYTYRPSTRRMSNPYIQARR